jgi:protein involved in polysaccharide export with SLBB domain
MKNRSVRHLLFVLAAASVGPVMNMAAAQQQPAEQSAPTASPQKQTADASTTDPQRPALRQRYPRYRIRSSDVIDLNFRFTPEFNQEVTVQPDGYIQARGLQNDVYVQGLTVAEMTTALQKAYANILNQPEISVTLKDFDRPYFVAGGLVGKPGKYDLRGTTTATQAVAMAGGFADGAKNSQVVLFRRANTDDWVEVKVLNLKDVLKGKKLNEDTVLQPGDMLYVPKSTWSKIEKFLPRSSLGAYFSPAIL